jgi:hypothetical protein
VAEDHFRRILTKLLDEQEFQETTAFLPCRTTMPIIPTPSTGKTTE